MLAGAALAHVAWKLRSESPEHKLMDDFLGLGLIGVVYGLSVVLGAWGFLAVFFAAVSLRQTELKLAGAGQASEEPQAAVGNAPAPGEPAATASRRRPSARVRWCSRNIWSGSRN